MAPDPVNEDVGVMSATLRFFFLSGVFGVSCPAWAEVAMSGDCAARPVDSTELIETSNSPEKSTFNDYFAQSGCDLEKAAQAGALWIGTEELLARSATEAEAGNWSEAIRLAKQSSFQAKTALEQAEHEKSAWKQRVIRKTADKP
jgi:hypothetical protein